MDETGFSVEASLRVERWWNERLLRVLLWIVAIGVWIALAVSLIGITYAVILGLFFFISHLTFITYLRGSAVRLGPEQFPELYHRVVDLSERIGLRRTPEIYVMQAGGTLNAMATKFLGANVVVLYSDLLDACGENTQARDFIVGHELGHIHAGHLRFRWLLLPGLLFPFVGTAYSRACEYTCDRYGLAAAGEDEQALAGLCILSAGGKLGPSVNRRSLVAQRADLETVGMKIGHWFATHPPIAHRLAALQPSLAEGALGSIWTTVGALGIVALFTLVPAGASLGLAFGVLPQLRQQMEAQRQQIDEQFEEARREAGATIKKDDMRQRVRSLFVVAEMHRTTSGDPPEDVQQLYELWRSTHPGEPEPVDPYDGQPFGYRLDDGEYVIFGSGPDPDSISDDIYYSSRAEAGE
jgi:Zn-dependent protease with chaperone function